MDDQRVQFQEYHVPRSSFEEKSKLITLVVTYSNGLIKNEKQAIYVLLGLVVVSVIISLFLVFGGSGGQKRPPLTPEERSFMETGHGL